jgi:cellobiose phosphorylase
MNKKTVKPWQFISNEGDFSLERPESSSYLYFPLANEAGVMSSITPTLNGDVKSSQNTFLSTPVSAEDLHNNKSSRNFWLYIEGTGAWSLSGSSPMQLASSFEEASAEKVKLEAGFLWHKLIRENHSIGIKAEVTNFAPVENYKTELMMVSITNTSDTAMKITPTAAVPIYGRSADNLRDHRHVTSLLNRISTVDNGVVVKPTLSFDERGHKSNDVLYSVIGTEDNGEKPVGFFPEIEEFVGEGGNLGWPEAVVCNKEPYSAAGQYFEGYEAIGALRFKAVELLPGETKAYIVMLSINEEGNDKEIKELVDIYGSLEKFNSALERNKAYWKKRIERPSFHSVDKTFDGWMKWINLQPILRRIYGCSFLPHHDYGRGGRGWRDLWQDCLALLIMEPKEVRSLLYNNYGGVRIDGSNATIIGSKPGEFIADRNNIARIWMDHGAWPFLTTKLYLDLSGDLDFLLAQQEYFKDRLVSRCTQGDTEWSIEQGNKLKEAGGEIYKGTILEHILIQNLTPFFNVGMHNNIRLEGADWNDGLDMAPEKGESVAFTAFYGSNLLEIAKLVRSLKAKKGVETIAVAEEMLTLFDTLDTAVNYNSIEEKKNLLMRYFESCKHNVSGKTVEVSVEKLAEDLEKKGNWIVNHVREQEWIKNSEGDQWFNGYYDNDGNRVEGDHENGTRMNLTSQVFTTMGGAATDEQVESIIKSADKYLKDSKVGGYRLNTNYHEVKKNLGRLFGFAFGHKENGAMFSHMAIMYGNALYKRGFAKAGYEVINSIYSQCVDFEKSRIYPGVPEYINEKGRGMYHYLTGSASWMLLTVLTETFGVKGDLGDLVIEPKLLASQFDEQGNAGVDALFADRNIKVIYNNSNKLDHGQYKIQAVTINGSEVSCELAGGKAVIKREVLEALEADKVHEISVQLSM